MDGPQGWGMCGILGGLFSLHTSQSSFKDEGGDQALGLGLLSPFNVLLTKEAPVEKRAGLHFGDNRIQCTISNYMPLTWLDKQPCPLPKDKGEALSFHTVIISASKTCQLSFHPHKALLRRESSMYFLQCYSHRPVIFLPE